MTKTVTLSADLLEELLESAKDGAVHKGSYLSEKYKEPELFAKFDAILAAPVADEPPLNTRHREADTLRCDCKYIPSFDRKVPQICAKCGDVIEL